MTGGELLGDYLVISNYEPKSHRSRISQGLPHLQESVLETHLEATILEIQKLG
ncbi:hypothetical protein [Nostoc sp. KVJ3]|uniref:hypothetical protein n=1 Tax=Nostoc sp. KVJ3 TaxID=457945 RepID=UPI0022382E1D|nr:hypothetical protein [Nostoc sp. KVJ3]